ncbi:MAG: glutaredoxin, partial [Thiomonas sp. 14-66-4]
MKVELFYSPGCTQCDGARTQLKAAALQRFPQVQWCECNVLEALDRAVEL